MTNDEGGAQDKEARFSFSTDSRDALFQLGYILADMLPDGVLQDAKRPLLISVVGTFGSGKKIIPDAMRERLFEGRPQLSGKLDYDEHWFGHHAGRDLELDFLNSLWSDGGYSDPVLNKIETPHKLTEVFLQSRKNGGLTFVHNDQVLDQSADIEIRVTKDLSGMSAYWDRDITVIVNDERLLGSPPLMAALRAMPERMHAETLKFNATPMEKPRFAVASQP